MQVPGVLSKQKIKIFGVVGTNLPLVFHEGRVKNSIRIIED